MNGTTMETDFVTLLRGHGFEGLRAPGSGTGDWPMPDVLAARHGVLIASELKSGANPRTVTKAEVTALERLADAFWAAAVIAVRYKGDRTFYLTTPEAMERTDSGNYSVPTDPERLPWAAAISYRKDAGGVQPVQDGGAKPHVDFSGDDEPPDLPAWLDAVTARQQGYPVRQGVVDGGRRPNADDTRGAGT